MAMSVILAEDRRRGTESLALGGGTFGSSRSRSAALAVFTGSDSFVRFEYYAEVFGVRITDALGDRADRQFARRQQVAGALHALMISSCIERPVSFRNFRFSVLRDKLT